VAILDVDVHCTIGTQGFFHARGNAPTVSIHAYPERLCPFFCG